MIKISFKFLIALSLMPSYIVANDFKAKAKFKPQYPKSAYVKRISGYAVVDFLINEKGRTEKQSIRSAKCFNLIDKNGNYYWYDFENDEIKAAYDCKYFDFKALKASKQLIYENYIGEPIEHSYRYNFRHWSLVKVDSVINLDSGNFVLE
jgi:hypothetical protein|tara:strand:- start:245 stop:694 length:450 start_codon:yes stop_codon:yes gene_type:complete